MTGKIVVLTGGTSGIGLAAAEVMAGGGARIVLVARDPERAEDALRRLRRIAPDGGHAVHIADLSTLAEAKRVGAAIVATEPRIDVLVNNAGALFNRRVETEDGFEMTFALNHLGYFVLTQALLPSIAAAAPARIVNTSSVGHRFASLDWDDLQSTRAYSGFGAYCRSKLCNVLFTRELARRVAGAKISASAFHPGFVASRFGENNPGAGRAVFDLAKSLFAVAPERGAETLVHLALAPELEGDTGGYYAGSKRVTPSRAASDDAAARRLWEVSVAMTGLGNDADVGA